MTEKHSKSPGPPWLGILLVPLLLLGCGDRGPAGKADPIRFLEAREGVEVLWPAGASSPPRKLAPATVGGAPQGGRIVRVSMSDTDDSASARWLVDDRPALLAPTGTRYRFSVELPAKPYLQVGLGSVSEAEGAPSTARFEIRLELPGGGSETLLDEVLDVGPEGRWQDRELSLERWAGRQAVIELATHATDGGPPVWAAWGAPEVVSRRGRDDGWDVVLISLDTLRPDHLGCYGYSRWPTSPAIDALARRGVRFATAVSQSPWTKPSHRALLTGLHPVARQGLASPPLAAALWRAGYRTAAMTGGGQVHPKFGFHAGFDTYRVTDWVRSVGEVVELYEEARGRKQLLFLHTYEIHDPYHHTTFTEGLPPGRVGTRFSKKNKDPHRLGKNPTAEERAYVEALYDGGIAFVDEKLGRLFDELETRGVFERAIVVLTSDHGEQFWEHGGWGHGTKVYDHQLLVPLILYLPPALSRELFGSEVAGRAVAQQVRLVDVYPTLLDLLGIPLGHRVQGRSLRPLLLGETMPEADAFAENTNVAVEAKALRSERFKLVYSYRKKKRASTGRMELYDLRRDPGEQRDLAGERPDLVEGLYQRMEEILYGSLDAEETEDEPESLDPKLREQLEALGYLGG